MIGSYCSTLNTVYGTPRQVMGNVQQSTLLPTTCSQLLNPTTSLQGPAGDEANSSVHVFNGSI